MNGKAVVLNITAMMFIGFIIRSIVFIFFIQPGAYYNQPDTPDYHFHALGLAHGKGMCRIDNNVPLFWRTPGYPLFLSACYRTFLDALPEGRFIANFDSFQKAHLGAIWIQIIISVLTIPLLFVLALIVTKSSLVALITSWFFTFHVGSVLASCYLLTETIAVFFFYFFLIFLFTAIRESNKFYVWKILSAAIFLSAYSWIRPMGEFIGILTTIFLVLLVPGTWSNAAKKGFLFGSIFFLTLAPWYIRNYQLTHDFFFCPTIGIYLNCFSVPKILRTTQNISLEAAHKQAQNNAREHLYTILQKGIKSPCLSPQRNKDVALPIIMRHPFLFAWDWFKEAMKTTFDLYAYQLVSIANGSFNYDPLEEFLTNKVTDCLYVQKIPLVSRVICWIEALYSCAIWIGFFVGVFSIISAFWQEKWNLMHETVQWIIALVLIAATVGMTGGFGYARLRLPIEPLIVIIATASWCTVATAYREKIITKRRFVKTVSS